jgi:ketosteroid isomerase-like protein
MTSTEITEQDIAALIERWSEAAQLYIDGDLRAYAAIARHADDYTLLPPHGGDARSGFDGSDDAVEWTARTFRGGQAELDVVKTYTSGDLVVLVAVERQVGTVGDLPPQELVVAHHPRVPSRGYGLAPRASTRRPARARGES